MYFLSKDCFVCNIQDYWIILSASRDRYMCVTHADLASIGHRLHGWQDRGNAAEYFAKFDSEADTLIDSLTLKGIVTANPSDGKPFAESKWLVCESGVENPEPDAPAKRPLFRVTRFFLACARIDWNLRKKNLFGTLSRIERRRLHVPLSAAICNVTYASTLIAAFKELRPLYPRPYLCLFDSLALLEFLASYRVFPQMVFGVVADPFQAHCWLQEGNVVLNDDIERVGKYKPILSV
jgi:hypothetical protein